MSSVDSLSTLFVSGLSVSHRLPCWFYSLVWEVVLEAWWLPSSAIGCRDINRCSIGIRRVAHTCQSVWASATCLCCLSFTFCLMWRWRILRFAAFSSASSCAPLRLFWRFQALQCDRWWSMWISRTVDPQWLLWERCLTVWEEYWVLLYLFGLWSEGAKKRWCIGALTECLLSLLRAMPFS